MHMSDALISPAVGGVFYAASAALLAAAAARTARDPQYARKLPLMGLMGAFVFAAQMINFSIPGTGSSGHIGGGLLLAVLLGPWQAFLVIASVLTVQCLFFADGGLLARGCNVFNLGFWPAFVGYPLFRIITRGGVGRGRYWAGSILGAAAALELGALSVVFQTLLSGRTELPVAGFAAVMLGIHLPIGLVEGVLTAVVAQWVWRAMPDRAGPAAVAAGGGRESRAAALATLAGLTLFVGMVLAWFASAHPDGLEWSVARVAGRPDLEARGGRWAGRLQAVQARTALLPDYGFAEAGPDAAAAEPESAAARAASWPAIQPGTSVAGLVGAGLTAGAILLIGWILGRWHRPAPQGPSS